LAKRLVPNPGTLFNTFPLATHYQNPPKATEIFGGNCKRLRDFIWCGNGYVFFLDGGKRAALVDPAGIPGNLLRILRDGAYHLEYIFVTHKHADHCDATADVAANFPKAKIVMHKADVEAIGSLANSALLVKDGEEVPFGDARIRLLHTPGHTDGSSSYLFKSTLFTGDTLFAGSVGGAYGNASTYEDILNSIRSKIFTLPEDTVLMPGHGPPSKVAWEKDHNPFF